MQLVEEIFVFRSRKKASSLSVHHQGLVFLKRSVRGADEFVTVCIWRR